MTGGRSAFARVLDGVFICAFLFFALFTAFWRATRSLGGAAAMAGLGVLAGGLLTARFFARRREKKRSRELLALKRELLLAELIARPQRDYEALIELLTGEADFVALPNHPGEAVRAGQILALFRAGEQPAGIVSPSEFSQEALELAAQLFPDAKLTDGAALLAIAERRGMLPDDAEAAARAEELRRERRRRAGETRRALFTRAKAPAYLLGAALFAVWGVLFGMNLFYIAGGAICGAVAVGVILRGRLRGEC